MTTSKSAEGRKRNSAGSAVVPVTQKSETRLATAPEILLSATVQNAVAMDAWGKFAGEGDLTALIKGSRERLEKVQDGDMRSVESMLYGQAMTLQTIFTNLARRSAMNAGEYMNATDTYLRLALKAQAQCRSTLETLAEIKNPRSVSFVKQANIANGPQQVNNSTPRKSEQHAQPGHNAHAGAHAGENAGQQNELLEHQHGNYLDTGAQDAAGGADPHLEAVDARQRATHP